MFEDKGEGEFVTLREIVNYWEQQFGKQHKEYMRELRFIRWIWVAWFVALVFGAILRAV